LYSHKVVTSEALGPGSVLLKERREKVREKRNVFSLDLNTVTESLLRTMIPVVNSRLTVQSIGKRVSRM